MVETFSGGPINGPWDATVLDEGTIAAVSSVLAIIAAAAYGQEHSIAPRPGTITTISSTVPSNGDVNPYGVFRIPRSAGKLTRGNILVSNFNNGSNLQGTGTTLVQIAPNGSFSLFAQIDPNALPEPCPGGVGLTTALVVLRSGWVIVGSLPTLQWNIGDSPGWVLARAGQ